MVSLVSVLLFASVNVTTCFTSCPVVFLETLIFKCPLSIFSNVIPLACPWSTSQSKSVTTSNIVSPPFTLKQSNSFDKVINDPRPFCFTEIRLVIWSIKRISIHPSLCFISGFSSNSITIESGFKACPR